MAADVLRPVRDEDAQDLIGLITLCFAQYPGCYFDPHDDMPDIVWPARSPLAQSGLFLAAEDERGRVCACGAVDFPEASTAELHRLYVRPDQQGRGLGRLLLARLTDHARERGAARVVAWSDTRFTRAHDLYQRAGFVPAGVTRSLGDVSLSREHRFDLEL